MIYFLADPHWHHPKIVNICNRPIEVENHNEWLIEIWNSTITKKDTVYILGDVSMGNKAKTEVILDKLHGTKHLILGNHDNCIHNSTRFESVSQIKDFTYNVPDENGVISNIHIVLCHYPLASWNRKIHGSFHLYGHVHGRFQNHGMSLDCGIDATNYKILNIEEWLDKFTKRSLEILP